MKAIESITEFIQETNYDNLPKEVVYKVKTILLDTLGVGLSGFKTKPGEIVINVIKNLSGKNESTILGDGSKVNCVQAGYVNSYLIDVMDYEETYKGLCHTNASVVPSALAVGEHVNSSGKDIINAIVIGNEIAIRIGLAIRPTRETSEKFGTISGYTYHCFGSAATASKLLNLKKDQIMNAFGFAGSSTSLPTSATRWDRPLSWIKNNFLRQTDAGILGALMAQQGFTAPVDILDSDFGFWKMAGSDRYDIERVKEGLGKEYEILEVSLKPYPACRWFHATLDAIANIMKDAHLKPQEINQINVRSVSELKNWFVDYEPKHLVDAEFSIPYAVAMMILGYKPGLDWFKEETLRDPNVLSVVRKVKVESTPKADETYYESSVQMASSAVEIVLEDGRHLNRSLDTEKDNLRGSPKNPIDVIEKFKSCVLSAGMKVNQAEELMDIVDNLERVQEISELTRLLKIQ
jgi:2-methylcitrate dehydratase PrpD